MIPGCLLPTAGIMASHPGAGGWQFEALERAPPVAPEAWASGPVTWAFEACLGLPGSRAAKWFFQLRPAEKGGLNRMNLGCIRQ